MYSQSHLGWHFRKLKAQSSNVSFATFQWKETFELWASSFETAFENAPQVGSAVLLFLWSTCDNLMFLNSTKKSTVAAGRNRQLLANWIGLITFQKVRLTCKGPKLNVLIRDKIFRRRCPLDAQWQILFVGALSLASRMGIAHRQASDRERSRHLGAYVALEIRRGSTI